MWLYGHGVSPKKPKLSHELLATFRRSQIRAFMAMRAHVLPGVQECQEKSSEKPEEFLSTSSVHLSCLRSSVSFTETKQTGPI
jgi:hypothetical protein